MMKELSMHILDIASNSIRAEAKKIKIKVEEKTRLDRIRFTIEDDGKGMEACLLMKVRDPFATSRTLRKVGLGIPLLDMTCKQCNGSLSISSAIGKGTKVIATLEYSHIDRPPLGDIASTVVGLITSYPNICFFYHHIKEDKEFRISTNEITRVLEGEVDMSNIQIYQWILTFVKEQISDLYSENTN